MSARAQGVVATVACWSERRWSSRASAGVFQPRVLRGRLLSAAAEAARSPWGGVAKARAVGVAEVHVDVGVDAQLSVLGHLGALIPGSETGAAVRAAS